MINLVLFVLAVQPFYDANFSSLPIRSVSVFSNPAGLGSRPGSELLFTYHPDVYMSAITAANLGFGMMKIDSITYYEIGGGYKLPGAFSVGYAYQWGDTSSHVLGVIGRVNKNISVGYRTTLGGTNHMFGGMSVRPYEELVTLSADVEYEGIDSILNFYLGMILQPLTGVKLNFHTAHNDSEFTDFDWNTGLELSFGRFKLAGEYASRDEKFSAGIIISAQQYETFIPPRTKISRLRLKSEYPEIERKTVFGIPVGMRQGFTKLLGDLKSLTARNDVQVILVELEVRAPGAAQSEELKAVLTELKNSGKDIVFYGESYHGTLTYELACTGDEVILAPSGSVFIPGLAMRRFYLKGTLEKLGLETDIVSIGEYKTAVEIFTRTDMSDADHEQLEKILDDIYYPAVQSIAHARGKTIENVETLMNTKAYFNSDDARAYGLVDTLLYDFELEDYVLNKYGRLEMVDITKGLGDKTIDEAWQDTRPKIALVIAEGTMVAGKGEQSLFQSTLIGGDTFARVFDGIRKDKSIKAVILRVNSGGGDAVATEKMTRALQKCQEEKPVIVSMGGVAGSGGYHVACLADRIYANNNTLTGSIGVFGISLITAGLYDKLGISWDYVKKGEHTDAFWGLRHLTEDELERERAEVTWWYDRFVNTVAQGRNMSQQKVDSLGQGRVYTGRHAKKVGLIDETGSFLDALEAAKELAQISGDVDIVVYPRSTGFSLFGTSSRQSSIAYLMPELEIR